ncbi:hypothetical protein RvY_14855 [Ramazzottius varieornatus]|uniref:Uncharacterized protein n=1 Tax=Ramazzottius varieornatus TaxID=947166 RepID=A0A1D1VU96_RAMVA|nr:hypothetical protein RvY_14855 [Ramazzottius varieornatus]
MQEVSFEDAVATMLSILQHILDVVQANVSDQDLVGLRIETRSLEIPIWTPPVLKFDLTVDRWMLEVQTVLNSQEESKFDDSFNIIVSYATPLFEAGSGKIPRRLKKRLKRSMSIVTIDNCNEICMARAIVVGIAHSEGNRTEYKKLCDKRTVHQKSKALQLIEEAGLAVRVYSIADIPAFEAGSTNVTRVTTVYMTIGANIAVRCAYVTNAHVTKTLKYRVPIATEYSSDKTATTTTSQKAKQDQTIGMPRAAISIDVRNVTRRSTIGIVHREMNTDETIHIVILRIVPIAGSQVLHEKVTFFG